MQAPGGLILVQALLISLLVIRCHFRFAYFWHTFDAPLYFAWARRVFCTWMPVLLLVRSHSLFAAEAAARGAETGAEYIMTKSVEFLRVHEDRIVDCRRWPKGASHELAA